MEYNELLDKYQAAEYLLNLFSNHIEWKGLTDRLLRQNELTQEMIDRYIDNVDWEQISRSNLINSEFIIKYNKF